METFCNRDQLRLVGLTDRLKPARLSGDLRTKIAEAIKVSHFFYNDESFPVSGEWDIAIIDIRESRELLQRINQLCSENPGIRILRFKADDEGSDSIELFSDPSDQVLPEPVEGNLRTILNLVERSIRVAEMVRSWKLEKHLLEEYRSAVDAGSILSITDPRGIIKYVNINFCAISGYTREELIGKPHNIIRHPEMEPEIFRKMWQTIQDRKVWKGVVKNRKKDGSYYVVSTTVSPLLNEMGEVVEYVSLRSDITDLVKEKERTTIAATMDSLTGLLNRYSLQQEIAKGGLFHAAVINLNGFSNINEFYGEKAGDEILSQVAELLRKKTKGNFSTFRAGADEFVVLGKENKDLLALTVDIIEEIRHTAFPFDSMSMLHVAATAGVSLNSSDPYREASAALKHARLKKEPCVVYSSRLDARDQHKKNAELSSRVIRGIIHNRIIPYYQPIVNLNTGKVFKYEALLRLVCEDGLIIPPLDAIRIARLSGQYRDMTQTFLKCVFGHMEKNSSSVSVNLTYDDLSHEGTVEMIFNALKKGTFAERITFEITEAEDMEDFELVKSFIATARSFGGRSAIDDFGSGYSNFVNLLKLDIDYLKIDGSLVEALPLAGKTENIIRFIVDFAKNNNIETIGEFVSSEYLAKELKNLGVNYGQGFHLGKPAPLESFIL